jgi:hypothetical protein
MAEEGENRQPRWNTAGYWTDQREGEDWQGDRSRSRDYGREDIRQYNRRAIAQGEALRRLRGEYERLPSAGVRNRGYAEPFRSSPYWNRGDDRDYFRYEPGRKFRGDRGPGVNLVDNYWGRREMGRNYHIRDRGAWWNNVGGRPDLTSARYYRSDLPTRPSFEWIEDEDYDLDPGYDYEFGTDFDWMGDISPDNFRQPARYREFWNVPGPFTGIGPSGYHPSDERIQENICEILTRNGRIDSSNISVQVENGLVTLQGSVQYRPEKHLAEEIASAVGGVTDVDNRLRVQHRYND